jgi:hypothetical protein
VFARRFDDETANPLPDNTQLTSGSFKPNPGTLTLTGGARDAPVPLDFPLTAPAEPYAEDLSVFDRTIPNGTWKLYVLDDSSGDGLELERAELRAL